MKIPLMRPKLPKFNKVSKQIKEILETGMITNSKYVNKFERELEKFLKVKHVITFPNGTSALTAMLSTLPRGSKVIVPSHTFSATLAAIEWNGLIPNFVDCDTYGQMDLTTGGIDLTNLSAILGVHMYGKDCEIGLTTELAKQLRVKAFFDGAQSFGVTTEYGDATMFSFGATKTFTTCEGGIIATNDDKLAEHYRLVKDNGHEKYGMNVLTLGLNGRMQEFSAIIGLESLKTFKQDLKIRRKKAELFRKKIFKELHGRLSIILPNNLEETTIKDFAILIENRDKVFDYLTKKGIQCKLYFSPPLHLSDYGLIKYGLIKLSNTEDFCNKTLSIPFYNEISESEMDYIVEKLKEVL